MCLIKCIVFIVVCNFIIISGQEDIFTEDNNSYRFWVPVKGSSVSFKVDARNDAHVALSKHPRFFVPMYEFVIGGQANSKTVLRKLTCLPREIDEVETPQILNDEEFRGFWIRWDNGLVQVGREGEDNPFMSWQDPKPFLVTYVGVRTTSGSNGNWKLANGSRYIGGDENSMDVTTVADRWPQYFPVSGSAVHFKVRARNDVKIELTSKPKKTDPMYEIVMGGWSNTKTVIRKWVCRIAERDEKQTPQILKDNQFRGFWLRWDHGNVLVGRERETQPFLSWQDPEPVRVAYVGVRTTSGSSGNWKLASGSNNGDAIINVVTENDPKWQFFPIPGDSLKIKVRASNDATIGLATHPWETDPMYEIVLGGWKNTKSVLRRLCCLNPDKAEALTPQILKSGHAQGFWLRWDGGNFVAGREGETDSFISWRDPDPFPVAYMGVHTRHGSSGNWTIGDTPAETSNINIDVATGDILLYQFFPVSGTSTQFKVHARNDAHVALATLPRESAPMYELVIGGSGNTKSFIRRMTCFPWDRDIVKTPGIVSGGENRAFWMRWDNATIMVGREGENQPFMSWLDLDPLAVSHLGVHTGFGSSGTWEIDNLRDSTETKAVSTGENTEYQFFPISSSSVKFRVQANSDVHVGLFSEGRETDPMYEAVIGGWGNTQSVIRKKYCYLKSEKYEVATPNFLDENQFRGFWVSWDNGHVQVGKDGENDPFMSWQDLNPIKVTHMGLHTGFGSSGFWRITNESRNNAEEDISTGDNTLYQYYPISRKSLRFKVRARNDVHVGLTTGPQETDPMYEIVIGGWANLKSVIRKRCCLPSERVEVHTPEILNDGGYRGFWISWDKGDIMAGREGDKRSFMKWNDPEPFPINYLGVHTGFGSSGTWKIGKGNSTAIDNRDTKKPDVVPLVVIEETPAPPECAPTLTRLHQGTACAGQVVFEENFDTLRENIWQVQQYVPLDHPELPFISYQRSTVFVKNGNLRITPALQQKQPGFTYYSLYGTLDLYNGCTSGLTPLCQVEASHGSFILPPVIGGRITSRSSFAFTYGIISVRAKLPQGDWIYPEILLEPLLKKFLFESKNSGMLKIACARGNLELSKGTTQYGNKVLYSGPVIDTECHEALIVTKKSDMFWGDDFHVYSAKWTPESVTLLVDGQEYGRVEPGNDGLRSLLPETCAGPQQPGMAPFDDHFYITLGLAAGGHAVFPDASFSKGHKKPWRNHASKATLNFWNDIDVWHDTWDFPELLVDYVKVVAL